MKNSGLLIGLSTFTLGLILGYVIRGDMQEVVGQQGGADLNSSDINVTAASVEVRHVGSSRGEEIVVRDADSQTAWEDNAASSDVERKPVIFDGAAALREPTYYIESLNALVAGSEDPDQIERLLTEWGSTDSEGVVAWLANQSPLEDYERFYFDVYNRYMENDVAAAGAMLAQIDNTGVRAQLIPDYVHTLSMNDPLQALGWLNGILEEDIRAESLRRLFQNWVESAPQQALDYLFTLPNVEQTLQQEIAGHAAALVSKDDPLTASYSISQYPAKVQPQIAYGIVESWTQKDQVAARNWVDALGKGVVKDEAIQSYIDFSESSKRSVATLELATSVDNDEARKAAITRIFEEWSYTDPIAAKAGIAESSLIDDSLKESLLGSVSE